MNIKTKLLIVTTHAILVMGSNAMAGAVFTNGGFEDGNLNGWSVSSSSSATPTYVAQTSATSVASVSNGGLAANIMTPLTIDPLVPIQTVYDGSASVRVGDSTPWGVVPGGGVQYNQITQTALVAAEPSTTTDPGHLFFAWAAVEEISGHAPTDTPFFRVSVLDLTTSTLIYDVSHFETDGGAWVDNGNGWKYSTNSNVLDPKGWNVNDLNLSALGVAVGDSLQLTAIARDCNLSGHAMYVYLDGFGATKPISNVPEPTTIALMGLGLLGFAARRRNKA
jgi:hypothetical protein